MGALDISAIVMSGITLITLIINVIFKLINKRQDAGINNDKQQWEIIHTLINAMVHKQEEMCSSITKLFQKFKEFKTENDKKKE